MATRAPTSSRAVPVDARFFFGVVEATRGAGANEVGAATGTGFTGVLGTGSVAQVGGGVEPGVGSLMVIAWTPFERTLSGGC